MAPRELTPSLQSLPPILDNESQTSTQSCSKGSRGLSVQPRVLGIFTETTVSPDPSLRQHPSRYSIRAGRNLPDKEFRYLRTVIVTAAVHRGFSSNQIVIPLTFRHWAGVSPYTSTFVLAETCVFGKQLHGFLSCGPSSSLTRRALTNLQFTFTDYLSIYIYQCSCNEK